MRKEPATQTPSAWCAADIVAHAHGRTVDDAAKDSALHMESVRR